MGEALEHGSLYRLVPNWKGFWDYRAGRPEPRAFRKDADGGVSMVIATSWATGSGMASIPLAEVR